MSVSRLFIHPVNFRATEDATSPTSPASISIKGGLAVAKSSYIGGNLNTIGTIFAQSGVSIASGELDVGSNPVVNVPTPVNPQDASNKSYVDNLINNPSQPHITSVGTLTSLNVSGSASFTSTVDATSPLVGGSATFGGGIGVSSTLWVGGTQGIKTTNLTGPIITKDVNRFASGLYTNTGRSGLFYESNDWLTLGVANLGSSNNNGVQIVSYNSDSSFTPWLTVWAYNGTISVKSTTDAFSGTTGGFLVSGGASVQKSLWLGNVSSISGAALNIAYNAASSQIYLYGSGSTSIYQNLVETTSAGDLHVLSKKNVVIDATTNVTLNAIVVVTNTTDSSSVGTGALTVSGGISSGGNVYVGGNVNAATAPTVGAHLANKTYVDGVTYLTAGTGLTKAGATISVNAAQTGITSVGTLTGLTSSGIVSVTSTIDSTSTTTGAVQISGGVGIKGSASIGGSVSISDITTYTEDGNIYPPGSLTALSTDLSGFQNMANGTYVLSASSSSGNNIMNAFNRNNPTGYWESGATYSGGTYTGAVTTTDVAGNVYAGEWIQIAFPNSIKVGSIIVDPMNQQLFLFKNYALLGSNDGNTWNLVTSGTTTFTLNTVNVLTFTNGTNTAFIYYRLVVMSTAGGGTSTRLPSLSFRESSILRLGNEYDRVGIGNVPLYSKTTFSVNPYPPVTLCHTTANLQGYEWGNGTYIVSGSSTFGNASYNSALYAFSKEIGNYWWSSNMYNNGTYTGSVSTIIDGNAVRGEWVQIKLPDGILLQSFTATPIDTTTIFSGYTLAGSLDGTTWTAIGSGTAVWNAVASQTFVVVSTTYMPYYRLVTTTITSTSATQGTRIGNLTLNGLGPTQSLQIDGNVSVSTLSYGNEVPFYTEDGVVYPPGPLTANVNTLATYGSAYNGAYIVSASNVNGSNYVYKAFNRDANSDYWESTTGVYTSAGVYTGSVTTTVDDGTMYAGEWLQIQLPTPIKLKQMLIYPFAHVTYMCNKYVLLGSNDGTTWTSVIAGTMNFTSFVTTYVDVNSQTTYSYYRLVASTLNGNGTSFRMVHWLLRSGSVLKLGTTYDDVNIAGVCVHGNLTYGNKAYPPGNLSDVTTNVQGYAYGNGLYSVAWSSTLYLASMSDTDIGSVSGLNAFTKENGNYWSSVSNRYSAGQPTASTVYTNVGGVMYQGEWVQIKLPEAILLTSFSATPTDVRYIFQNYVFAASTDGVNWTSLSNGTATGWTVNVPQTFNVTASRIYAYYRIICLTLNTTTAGGMGAQIGNVTLYGSGMSSSLEMDGNLIVGSTTDTTGSNSGALQVQGGLGISKSIFAGANVNANGNLASYTTTVYGPSNIYPPQAMNAASKTFSGLAYGNGTYAVTSSGTYSTNYAYYSFDQTANFWSSPGYTNMGTYIGTTSTTVDGTSVMGEWIQLALPIAITVRSVVISWNNAIFNPVTGPTSLVIAGSNDGTTWTGIYSTFPISWPTFTSSNTFSVFSTSTFTYFRVITIAIGIGTAGNVAIPEMSIYGTEDVLPTSTANALRVAGSGSLSKNLVVGSTTNSISVGTGALIVGGGISSGGNIYVGGNVNASTAPTVGAHLANKTYVDGVTYLTAGTGLTKAGSTISVNAAQTGITSVGTLTGLTSSGVVSVTSTIDSISTTTGSVQLAGGLGIAKSMYVGNTATVNSLVTSSTNTSFGIKPYTSQSTFSGGGAMILTGYASPTAGRLIVGDGTGWNFFVSSLNSAGTLKDLVTFQDTGTVILSGGSLSLTNGTSNLVTFSNFGTAVPSTGTRSTGTKISLWNELSIGNSEYAIGMEGNAMWNSVSSTSSNFKWYGGTTLALTVSGTGNVTAVGDVSAFSDARLKDNIVQISEAIDTVCQLRGVRYRDKRSNKSKIGLVAQEVLTVLPEVVNKHEVESNEADGYYSVAYGNLVAVLVEAVKELNVRMKALENVDVKLLLRKLLAEKDFVVQ